MFERPRISYIVMVLLLILPQSLYVIGDYLAVGIRFPFFRIQDSSYGSSSITVVQDVRYVIRGTVGGLAGRTALATYAWVAGLVVLVAAAILVLSWHLLENSDYARFPGPLIVLAGVFFLAWGMIQYGPLFSGVSGYAVPVGVPILWYCGYQFILAAKRVEAQPAPVDS